MKWYYKILIFRNKFITPYVQILLLFSKVASCFMSLVFLLTAVYKYGFQIYRKYNNEEARGEMNNSQTSVNVALFDDIFLLDGERQLRIKYDPNISSFKQNIPEARLETIGSKYPSAEETAAKNMSKKNNKPIVTYILLAINIIVFALMYILGKGSEDSNTLLKFGAHTTTLIRAGQFYRIFTCAFLHIGLIHLFCNMYSLFQIGPTIEYFFGKVKFILIY